MAGNRREPRPTALANLDLAGASTKVPESRAASIDPTERPVGELIRSAAVVCAPTTSVRDAAERMVTAGATAVLVDLGDGLGIVTDRDLSTRVMATGGSSETPLRAAMTVPAITVAAERSGAEVLLEMLERDVRHFPVVDIAGRVIGIVDDIDLMVAERLSPFHLQKAVARGGDVDAVVGLARRLPAVVIDLHDSRVAPTTISRIIASIHDALTQRLIALATHDLGASPADFTWLTLGSNGRRESFPGSDQDSALAWLGGRNESATGQSLRLLAGRVEAGLAACGMLADPNGARASRARFSRSVAGWERAATAWAAELDYEGVIVLSAMVDGRPVTRTDVVGARIVEVFRQRSDPDQMSRRLAVVALAHRPPTAFVRDFVVEHTGARKGLFDIKQGGLRPIVDLARWAVIAAQGPLPTSTLARLGVAEAAGTLETHDAAILRDAFELVTSIRMRHQVEQLRAGLSPTDHIDPAELAGLTRRYLKEAFQAIRHVQRGVELKVGVRPT
ncbi:MAG: DUF294 nucleotidyltransferase-like domain-containing protein [Candidatus Dormibacteraeota bacterium]|nr:DUF294 nucleotidyltransferase-like domain-containing protein [Candidatus Dormibacteraeota bacterium]